MTAPAELDVEEYLAGLRTGTWLDAQEFPPLAWAVPGLVPEGIGLLVGPPKAGKSWAALGIALAVASGGRAFGHVPVGPARPVLYLALEDGDRRLQERARTLLHGAPIPALLSYETRLAPELIPPVIGAWLALHHHHGNPLVLLDTLGKVMPPARAGENQYGRDYRIGSVLKAPVDKYPGCTVLAVHHDRKASGDDFVDSVSGTHGLAGAADFVLVLDRKRQETGAILKVTGRDVHEAEYAIDMRDGSWTLQGRSLDEAAQAVGQQRAAAGLGARSTQIVDIVHAHPRGIGPTAVGVYLGRLSDAGRINKAGRGLYVPVETVECRNPYIQMLPTEEEEET